MTLKVTEVLRALVCEAGCTTITGGPGKVSVATWLVTTPTGFLTTTV